MLIAIVVICFASTLWWAWSLYATVRTALGVPRLVDDRSVAPARWPRVSLVVAARNEERDLERALRTRLADDYPELQVVIVEDRSTDRTAEIADSIARNDPRVKVVHITELPKGWLGKLHAMHRGVEASDGEWLLFSDADVEFAPGTLRRSIARCELDGKDHMCALPLFREHGLGVDAAMDVFAQLLIVGGRLWQVPDPHSRAAVGGGMFNLVRRSAYDRTPGFAWLKLEIADDVALGQMLKRHGARPIVVNAVGAVALDFYASLGEMAYGLEKSGFAIMGRFRYQYLLISCGLGFIFEAGFFAGFAHPALWVRLIACATLTAACASQALMARMMKRSVLPSLLFPLGMAAMIFMALRSGWLAWRRGGVLWRGTRYSVRELREGARIELT